MSAGQFKAGAPSRNPIGRPTKEAALVRDLECVRREFGLEGYEQEALVAALLSGKPEAIAATFELIHRRLYADLLACRADMDEEERAEVKGRAERKKGAVDDDNLF